MKSSKKTLDPTTIKRNSTVFLKKNFENFGCEVIFNEIGQVIGKIIIPFLNLNKIFKIKDINSKKVIVIEKKNKLLSKICYLKENNEKIIASVRKSRFKTKPSKIWLRHDSKNKKYYAIGDFKQFKYEIINSTDNKIIATVIDTDKKEFLPKNKQKILQNYCCIKLFNLKGVNILIMAFIICINLLNHLSSGISDLAGFERKIARLRPFGPGKNLN